MLGDLGTLSLIEVFMSPSRDDWMTRGRDVLISKFHSQPGKWDCKEGKDAEK